MTRRHLVTMAALASLWLAGRPAAQDHTTPEIGKGDFTQGNRR